MALSSPKSVLDKMNKLPFLSLANLNGKTPLDLARDEDHTETAELVSWFGISCVEQSGQLLLG